MADSPGTGISVLQILSVPALLAAITGVGSFLKSLWDKWSERRSLIGLQKLTDYLDLDSKRDIPLLTRQTRELIDYEVNLRFREFAGTPADGAIEKIERWRRKPYLIRALWIPSEIRKQLGLTLELPKESKVKQSKNISISRLILISALSYVTLLVAGFLNSAWMLGTILEMPQHQSTLRFTLLVVVVVISLVVFSIWARLLANADRIAREFVKKNDKQEVACVKDDC